MNHKRDIKVLRENRKCKLAIIVLKSKVFKRGRKNMALSKLQVEETLELFLKNFINETTGINRKRLFQRFEDVFGKGIVEWKALILEAMKERSIATEIIDEFTNLMGEKNNSSIDYEYRELREEDFIMVRELINRAFDTILTELDDEHLKNFLNGYSMVACDKGDIIGVIMCYPIMSLQSNMLYVDSLVVAEYARGRGIARTLLEKVKSKSIKNRIYCLKLMTDKHLDAYQMYQHLGFNESKYVLMSKW